MPASAQSFKHSAGQPVERFPDTPRASRRPGASSADPSESEQRKEQALTRRPGGVLGRKPSEICVVPSPNSLALTFAAPRGAGETKGCRRTGSGAHPHLPLRSVQARRARPQGPGAPHTKIHPVFQPPQTPHAHHGQCQAPWCKEAAPVRLALRDPRVLSTALSLSAPASKVLASRLLLSIPDNCQGAGAKVPAGGSSSRVLARGLPVQGYTRSCTCRRAVLGHQEHHSSTTPPAAFLT